MPDEVVIEVAATATPGAIEALERRHQLTPLDQFASQLTGTIVLRARVPQQRTVAAVIRALGTDAAALSAQPNYRFVLMQQSTLAASESESSLQYAAEKLHLTQAHAMARGDQGPDRHHRLRG